MRKIIPPFDHFDGTPIYKLSNPSAEIEISKKRRFKWFRKMICFIFGHNVKKYNGGYTYYGAKRFGGRSGQEKRPQWRWINKHLTEGYCSRCGKHFSNTQIKKTMTYKFPSGECEGQEFSVSIQRLTDWDVVLDSARFTIHKENITKEPSELFKDKILLSEHSPIRCLDYIIELKGVPCWVSQHLARHDAFAGHTMRDGAQDTPFVATSRTDRFNQGVPRSRLPQDTPVNHRIFLNAQDFITISQRRLCMCASFETRFVWQKILDELKEIDPILVSKCVRTCIYRGFCPEIEPCGYADTPTFNKKLEEYRYGYRKTIK